MRWIAILQSIFFVYTWSMVIKTADRRETMIPYAMMSGNWIWKEDRKIAFRILDLSVTGFTFRLSKKEGNLTENQPDRMRLAFLNEESTAYDVLELKQASYEILAEEESEDTILYRLETEDEAYAQAAARLMHQYVTYIQLKQETEPAVLSQVLTGYPAEKDAEISASFEAQKKIWFENIGPDKGWTETAGFFAEKGIALDRADLYEAYLKMDFGTMLHDYFERGGLKNHPASRLNYQLVYIGNSYCPHLCPKKEKLMALFERADELAHVPVLVLPPVSESRIEEMLDLLSVLADDYQKKGRRLEVVINDLSVTDMTLEKGWTCFDLTMGLLLCKRRKDPRMAYLKDLGDYGTDQGETALGAPDYEAWLKEAGITGISREASGTLFKVSGFKTTLHMPYYQTNTSGHCTLYAACKNGRRGQQTPVSVCPQYCRKHVYLYPDHLRMAGICNSLFGLDLRSLTDSTYLEKLRSQSHRLVVGLL